MRLLGPRAWGLNPIIGAPSLGLSSKTKDAGSKKLEAFGRIVSNLMAGGLILLSLFTLVVLINQGMFERLVISNNAQSATYFWAPYGKACKLNAHGWVPSSCTTQQSVATTAAAWTSIGAVLATQWYLELQQATALHITTCLIGGTSAVGWGAIVFVAGYDAFPECLPSNGAQPIAGIAMLDTTVRDGSGVYFLTLYSDLNSSMQTVIEHTNTDGTTQPIMSNPFRSVIRPDGTYENDELGTDFIILSTPLGSRYTVDAYCITEIEVVTGLGLPGWSQGFRPCFHSSQWCGIGKHSGHAVSPCWNCGHSITNASELIFLQVAFIVLTLLALNGDFYITFEGIRGLVAGKPVLTYAVLSGLERRKLLIVLIALNAGPSLLYLDVSRIYYFSENGYKICWFSALPLPLPNKCVVYSAPIFLYASVVSIFIALCPMSNFSYANNQFSAGLPALSMYLNNATWPSGSYIPNGIPTVVQLFPTTILLPAAASLAFSILTATIRHYLATNEWLLSLEWCTTNGFVTYCSIPRFITSLPLQRSQAIKIGNKMFCRPSTMALLGYASVTEKDVDHHGVVPYQPNHKAGETYVVSVYALSLALLPSSFACLRPYVVGTVNENHFKPAKRNIDQLEHFRKYRYTRGNCVT
ncbi:hypothetical protein ACHHYP_02116 [Achlya hypogyna]|uniref:Transmembrane protein n=1 Tax=Achlya hypogyna TaxID=1202772 RepID=A0A1V9Z7D3_ACHHY|nr:hypothetical protein ACHHYP_02116 [Achlya hypogyna]